MIFLVVLGDAGKNGFPYVLIDLAAVSGGVFSVADMTGSQCCLFQHLSHQVMSAPECFSVLNMRSAMLKVAL